MATSTHTCPDCSSELPAASRFCPSCGARTPQSMSAATGEVVRPPDGVTEEAAHRARLQRALGPAWNVTRLIGRGGFAEVYAVWDVNLSREVAVKTLRHDIEVSPQMIQRFRREAEAVARLRHPNIVPIYQVSEGEGLVYFIMPVIEGESLAGKLVRREAFSIAETCRILREVAGALGAAHRAGVVHRDVKPDNIMLEGPERRAVVMDFGIAKLADAAEARLTGTGLLIGSPHYMSPEQAAGETELDHRSDLYSLAVVGYQMLAGHMPFDSGSVQSILFKQMTETPPPITDVRPDVPPALAAALSKALSKRAEDRFQSMEEFAAALPAADSGAGPASARQTLDIRARAAIARETFAKWRIPALVAGVVGLVATIAGYEMNMSPAAKAVASSREDAVFAAKTVLSPPRGAGLQSDLVSEDSLYRFIYKAAGSRRAADSIASQMGVWRWRVRTGTSERRSVTADIGAGARVMSVAVTEPDTITRPSVSNDSAKAIAEGVLRARSWQPARLHFLGDSTSVHGTRTDHVLKWDAGGISLKAPDGSPATHQVVVRVRGDTVAAYREMVVLPKSATKKRGNDIVRTIAGIVVAIVSCAAAFLAFVLMIKRARVDDLQWKPVAVLFALAVIPAMIVFGVVQSSSPGAGSAAGIFGVEIFLALIAAVLLVPFVVAESVLSERHPALVSGIPEAARGRLFIPELATAALIGYPAGLCLCALGMLLALVGQSVFGRVISPDVDGVVSANAPALMPVLELALGIAVAFAIAYGVSLFAAWRKPVVLSLLTPAAFVVLTALTGNAHPLDWSAVVGATLALTLILWRFGVFAAIVTLFVSSGVVGVITLFVVSEPNGLASAIVAAVLFATPGVIGILAYRRLAR